MNGNNASNQRTGQEPVHPILPTGLKLGAPFGITLRLHWTFLVLAGILAVQVFGQTGSIFAVGDRVLIATLLFGSVALHEYGHALAARHYGIGTREITLLPIGGLAQLERAPSDPRHELFIALAGPLVNFVLAAAAWLLAGVLGAGPEVAGIGLLGGSLLGFVLWANLVMGLFNLLPALPMDGGRVLRAALSLRMPALRATRIATQIAQVLAAGMVAYGVLGGRWMLAVIGGFVWITARAELRRAEVEALLKERARRMAEAGFDPSMFATFGDDPAGEWHQPEAGDAEPKARVVGRSSTHRTS